MFFFFLLKRKTGKTFPDQNLIGPSASFSVKD